jgi:hypothetical protein
LAFTGAETTFLGKAVLELFLETRKPREVREAAIPLAGPTGYGGRTLQSQCDEIAPVFADATRANVPAVLARLAAEISATAAISKIKTEVQSKTELAMRPVKDFAG